MENLYRIKGNEPLLLLDPQKVWVVETGSLSVFATKLKDSTPVGERRYLFSVGAGEALFGAAINSGLGTGDKSGRGGEGENTQLPIANSFGFLAVAIEPTELSLISITDLVAQVAAGDSRAIIIAETWLNRIIQTLTNQSLAPDSNTVYKSLINPEIAVQLPTVLANLHTGYFEYLNKLQQEETEAAFRRFEEIKELNTQVVEDALIKLVAAGYKELGITDLKFLSEKTEYIPPSQISSWKLLLVVAGAVGRSMGITVCPPADADDISRVKDPVEAIARASQFRTRRVLLQGEWWRSNSGPLLAYTKEEKRPVALLPASSGYVLFDATSQRRVPVNKTVAATVAPEAQMFYRPLPNVVDKPIQLFLFGAKGYEKDIVLVLVIGIIGTLLGMVVPWGTGILIDQAIPDSDRVMLWQIGLALFALGCGKTAFQMSQGIISLRVSSAADIALQPAIWDRLLRLSPAFFRQYTSGDLVSRTLTVSQIRNKLSGATLRSLLGGIFGLLNLVLMFLYSWQLALVGVGVAFLTAAVTLVSGWLLLRKTREQLGLDGIINGFTIQLINGVAKLRVAMAEGRAFAAWADRYSQRIKLRASLQQITDNVSVFNEALTLITSAMLFWFATTSIQAAQETGGGLTPGMFLAFNSAFGIFIGSVSSLSNTVIDILGIMPLWERAEPILRSEPEDDSKKSNPGRLTGQVALHRVCFRYREDGPLILDDISFRAEPGEFIAFVGPSGSGKSTILRLLLGFETPLSGTVYYDGKDLRDLELVSVRRQLGVVLQNGRISAGSIFDNICAGALVSQQEAWQAAQMAGFAEDIQQMPMGMHTVVSEGGTNLSGGQRQRLLIARALVLKPKIILLDEATSALDNRTQAIVTESLGKLNATRIAIAHRLSTIANADRIYVIQAGRVMQVGRFEELVKQKGLFAELVARQME